MPPLPQSAADTAPLADPSIAGYAASDRATPTDTLGFKPYVEAIASFLIAPDTEPPITISIEGEWGSGKSSFLLQLEAAIHQISQTAAKENPSARLPPPHTLRFNAWRHDKQDQLWAAFALAFVESLRKEIGWRRALWGDTKLFFRRLHGFKAWAELALLLASLFIAAIVLWRYHACLTPTHVTALLSRLTADPKDSHLDSGLFARIAAHGFWGALASLAIAGFLRFKDSFKLPLSLSLKKYLAKPDYEGHTAFIEHFHNDLRRVVKSYAGWSRVFVFIDDLDRCDVPKAAELMQALNLMIGDSPNLIFILGMDREKVAAGIALKYKDLFPFLRESALWKPGTDKNDFTPLYFGYAYLEKFIQLSFALPIPNNETALNQFLAPSRSFMQRAVDRALSQQKRSFRRWLRFLNIFGLRLSKGPSATFRSVEGETLGHLSVSLGDVTVASADGSPNPFLDDPAPVAPPPAVAYHRVSVVDDNERTRAIVRMTAPLFEYNPRRIKQFTNTFRLALFLYSDLGMFDALQAQSGIPSLLSLSVLPPTAEQVGKIIALLLRFPDLRFALDQNPGILYALEQKALSRRAVLIPSDEQVNLTDELSAAADRWLEHPGIIDVLACNLDASQPQHIHAQYSLRIFPTSRLFTILPRAARPPAVEPQGPPTAQTPQPPAQSASPRTVPDLLPDQEVERTLAGIAIEYKRLRAEMPAGPSRTRLMEQQYRLAVEAWQLHYDLTNSLTDLGHIFVRNTEGERILFIAQAEAVPNPVFLDRLLRMAAEYDTWFENFRCLAVLETYLPTMKEKELERLLRALDQNWGDISQDPPRIALATRLKKKTIARLALEEVPPAIPQSPFTSVSAKTSPTLPQSPVSPPILRMPEDPDIFASAKPTTSSSVSTSFPERTRSKPRVTPDPVKTPPDVPA